MTSVNLSLIRFPEVDIPGLSEWLEETRAQNPRGGVWLFLPESEQHHLDVIQRVFVEKGIALAGAVFPALLDGNGLYDAGIIAFAWPTMPPVLLLDGIDRHPSHAISEIAALVDTAASTPESPPQTLFLFFDALIPFIGSLLDDLYLELADRVRYAGVNAGSETFKPIPCLFDEHRSVQSGVLAALLPPCEVILEHGYRPPETLIAATATEGNRILEIDWRPAFEVYRERILEQFGFGIDRNNFYQLGVHFPFGIQRADGELLVRIPVSIEEDGSLYCVGEVPEHAILTLLEAPNADDVATARGVAERLAGGSLERPLLIFYCAGRRLHLGQEAAEKELGILAEALTPRAFAGALSLGEIGSSQHGGYPLFHNATLVAIDPGDS